MNYVFVGLGILIFLIVQSYISNKQKKERIRAEIKSGYGDVSKEEYTHDNLEAIKHFYKNTIKDEFHIDDTTWDDLEMDDMFILINKSQSSIGQEYLYKLLRTPSFNKEELRKRDERIKYFADNEEKRVDIQYSFAKLGKCKGIAITDYIFNLNDLKNTTVVPSIIMCILAILSIMFFFVNPETAVLMLIVVFMVNFMSYFKYKSQIENYFHSIIYISRLLRTGKEIIKFDIEPMREETENVAKIVKRFASFEKKSKAVITGNAMGGSILDSIIDYLRMLFHFDIIAFHFMVKDINANIDSVMELLEYLGKIEAYISIASFREMLSLYAIPEFTDKKKYLKSVNMYHPMIDNAVANSIDTDKSVLITGSNASGKSTFLKVVAINSILAQTIMTTTAEEYVTSFFRTYSSMALRDNLKEKESYFIVEIKSLKRIIDAVDDSYAVLCFVDEILRGTNTVERIAASTKTLENMAKLNAMCFAATHDIELTYLLENIYDNYHFTEQVMDNDVIFDYRLNTGRAVSRNAIKLLSVIGYDDEIIKSAKACADRFVETGEWSI